MPRQKTVDHTQPLWVEAGDPSEAVLVSVAPIAPIDKLYTYTIDDASAHLVLPGRRVIVPFGRKGRLAPAIVVSVTRGPWNSTLKPIAEVLEEAGSLSDHLIELGQWISDYYYCPLGRTLAAMVPEAVRKKRGFQTVRHVRLLADAETIEAARLGAKQKQLIDVLQGSDASFEVGALLEESGASRSTLRGLITKGWVEETQTKVPVTYEPVQAERITPDYAINDAQQAALTRIEEGIDAEAFKAFLLYGVSGSGKTEVYIRAMQRVVVAGRQAIMLVPEIALTAQLMKRVAQRFDRVAVIHSGLSGVQRSLAWEDIRNGKTPVVVGTRSAIFAPCPNVGLIVVDEEQEPSYKNLQSPRFHVRDVAIMRAQKLGVPIVLGSATPSLETWNNCLHRKSYERLNLPKRVMERSMPPVKLVDMTHRSAPDKTVTISEPLRSALTETFERKQQSVVLINRRGFASWLFCPSCKTRIECRRCNAGMILHRSRGIVLCHHCHEQAPIPHRCPQMSCGGKLLTGGGGAERVEDELKQMFPAARIMRADSDTMTHATKYTELVKKMECGEVDILLGTQMIAKGLDFPSVALVGVIGADLTGAAGDFRASERLFQLVTQVAGRAGRAEIEGRVLVQTLTPSLPALRCSLTHDYCSFVESELAFRKEQYLPPFTRMARIVISGKRESELVADGTAIANRVRSISEELEAGASVVRVLGPHPCVLERLRGSYRFELLLVARSASELSNVLAAVRASGGFKSTSRTLMIDVDPVSLS
ncbi:MAG: primosomal protein N' [Phycisphaerae bacterium]|nr:primosomal protein N' [Phycisphaerales bacterium]